MHDLSKQSNEVRKLIRYLNLSPHPEGGFFSENYRSEGVIKEEGLSSDYNGERNFSTAIYFLLPQGHISHFHKVVSDEIWHFYAGGRLSIVELQSDGNYKETIMGPNVFEGDELQYVVPKNTWFAAFPHDDSEFSLVGCTVSPGFDYKDFLLGKKDELLGIYPSQKDLIEKYCLD